MTGVQTCALPISKEEAKRAGEARKAQASLDNRPSGKAPGAGRRGVVRL